MSRPLTESQLYELVGVLEAAAFLLSKVRMLSPDAEWREADELYLSAVALKAKLKPAADTRRGLAGAASEMEVARC